LASSTILSQYSSPSKGNSSNLCREARTEGYVNTCSGESSSSGQFLVSSGAICVHFHANEVTSSKSSNSFVISLLADIKDRNTNTTGYGFLSKYTKGIIIYLQCIFAFSLSPLVPFTISRPLDEAML
ncbi:hypothetical protein NPIL_484021, partial [Nephila pilipes]